MVNLTRIYTRTGDDGTHAPRRLQPHEQDRPAPRRLRRHQRGQHRDRGRGGRRRAARRRRPCSCAGAERPVRRRRRPVHPAAARPTSTRRCGSRRLGRRAGGRLRPLPRARWRSCARSSSPAARPGAALPARRHDGRAAGRALHLGRASRPTATSRARDDGRRWGQPPDGEVPQPALRPAVHPGPRGQPADRRRRPVAAGRRRASSSPAPRRGVTDGRGRPRRR